MESPFVNDASRPGQWKERVARSHDASDGAAKGRSETGMAAASSQMSGWGKNSGWISN